MKKVTFVILFACLIVPANRAQTNVGSETSSKIIALEHAWNQACEIKDVKSLDVLLDDSFVYVAPDGRMMSKADVIADVKGSDAIQVLTDSMSVHLHGDTAVADGVYRMKGIKHGKVFVWTGRFVDTWLLKNGVWVSIASIGTTSQ